MEIFRINKNNRDDYDEVFELLIGDKYKEDDLEKLMCMAVSEGEELCGVIAIDVTQECAVIECIYILPPFRSLGYGHKLLSAAELTVLTNGFDGIAATYWVDKSTGTNQYNYGAGFTKDFFVNCGYTVAELDMDANTEKENFGNIKDNLNNEGIESSDDNIQIMYAAKSL